MITGGSLYAGGGVRAVASFTDPDTGLPYDVTEPVVFTVRRPDGSVLTLTGTQKIPGTYVATFVAAVSGSYHVRAVTSDPAPGVTEREVRVRPSAI